MIKKKIAIIGAGISGIAVAIRLAIKGNDVIVYEKAPVAGGKITELQLGKYRFDYGPSLMTLPHVLEELFELTNYNINDFIIIKKIDVVCKYFFEDGTKITAHSNKKKFAKEIEEKTKEPHENILTYLKRCKELYILTANVFLFSPFQKLKTLLTEDAKKIAKKWWKLDFYLSMHRRNSKTFHYEKIVQIFDRFATYNGSNPYKAPATLNIISHLEHNLGSYIPSKGMIELTHGLISLAEKVGVKIKLNSNVDEILHNRNGVTGIRIKNKIESFNIVVSAMDIFNVYGKLLLHEKLPRSMRKIELSSSAIIFYWGIKNISSNLDIHNVLFSEHYKEEFNAVFKRKTLYSDPTVYIYISSKLNAKDAPEGCENWYVMINAPHDNGQDWTELVKKARQIIIKKINRLLDQNIENRIEVEEVACPPSIENYTSSYKGALYGPSSNSKLSAFYRHANFRKKIKGLYFTGGSVHPGGGIPLCLASAKIVDELIEEDYRNDIK